MPIDASNVTAVIAISERLCRTSVPSLFGKLSLHYLLGSSAPVEYAS